MIMDATLEFALCQLVAKYDDGDLFDVAHGSDSYDSPDRASEEPAPEKPE